MTSKPIKSLLTEVFSRILPFSILYYIYCDGESNAVQLWLARALSKKTELYGQVRVLHAMRESVSRRRQSSMVLCSIVGRWVVYYSSFPPILQGSESESGRSQHRPRSRDVASVTSL